MSRRKFSVIDEVTFIDPPPTARIHILARRVGAIIADILLETVHEYEPRLRPGHMRVLALVNGSPKRLIDIAAALGTTKQSVAPSVAELVDWGLVVRTVDDQDRRARTLTLTPYGATVTTAMLGRSIALDEEWGRLLGDDVEVCRSALWRIIQSQRPTDG